jgi:hypothetical protein
MNPVEASFNRFWIGYKLKNLSTPAFLNNLNNRLLPDLIKLAAGKGLVSYSPYVSPMSIEGVPDEIALITYQDEAIYTKIRSTPTGKAYGDLHWELFQRDLSKSTVSEQYLGHFEEGKAYELDSKFEDWQKGTTYVSVYRRKDSDLWLLGKTFKNLRKEPGLMNSIVLITKDFIYEYRSYYGTKIKMTPLSLPVVLSKELKKAPVHALGFGEGINAQF